jgi:hypothetical protein
VISLNSHKARGPSTGGKKKTKKISQGEQMERCQHSIAFVLSQNRSLSELECQEAAWLLQTGLQVPYWTVKVLSILARICSFLPSTGSNCLIPWLFQKLLDWV